MISILYVTSVIDVVDGDVIDADSVLDDVVDADSVLDEAVDADSTAVFPVVDIVGDDVESVVVDTADTDLVVSNSLYVDSFGPRIVDSLSVIRKECLGKSYFIDPLVVQRKRRTSLLKKKGDVRICICCLSYIVLKRETIV